MPKSRSSTKLSARAASFAGLPAHPAMASPDPFLEYRLGSDAPLRLPDSFNQPTAATVLRSEYTMSSDAAGELVFCEYPTLNTSAQSWVVTTTSGIGTTAAAAVTVAHPQFVALQAEARVARMVAMRINVTYIGRDDESSGYLSYSEKFALNDVNSTTVNALHTGSQIQVKAQEGLLVHLDYTQDPRWEGVTSGSFMVNTYGLGLFVASGLPASKSLFRIQVARFIEYLPLEGALAEGETAHEPHNPGALAAHAALSGDATSVTRHSDRKGFLQLVRNTANAAYHMAQPLIPYVVPAARTFLRNHYKQMAMGATTMLL